MEKIFKVPFFLSLLIVFTKLFDLSNDSVIELINVSFLTGVCVTTEQTNKMSQQTVSNKDIS